MTTNRIIICLLSTITLVSCSVFDNSKGHDTLLFNNFSNNDLFVDMCFDRNSIAFVINHYIITYPVNSERHRVDAGQSSDTALTVRRKTSIEEKMLYGCDTLFIIVSNHLDVELAHSYSSGQRAVRNSSKNNIAAFDYNVFLYTVEELDSLNWALSFPDSMGKDPVSFEYEYTYW